jgi:hypothetical protein
VVFVKKYGWINMISPAAPFYAERIKQ